MTEAKIASLPAAGRRRYYAVSRGLSVVVEPGGQRYFVAHATVVVKEGWRRPAQRTLGYWPRMSPAEARRQALYYCALADAGVDIRAGRRVVTGLPHDWLQVRQGGRTAILRAARRDAAQIAGKTTNTAPRRAGTALSRQEILKPAWAEGAAT